MRTYFPGLLGYDQRVVVAEQIAEAEARRTPMLAEITQAEDLEQVRADPRLIQYAVIAGAIAFANNCAPCHGLGGAGQGFFPSLADDQWIWGGTLDAIQQTIIHGVRYGEDLEAHNSQMSSFGAPATVSSLRAAGLEASPLPAAASPSDACDIKRARPNTGPDLIG